MFTGFFQTKLEWRRIAVYLPVRVAAVAVRNEDGSDRQLILQSCREGTRVVLRRDLTDPHDPNAIALIVDGNRQIGRLDANLSEWVAPLLDAGRAAFDSEIWAIQSDRDGNGLETTDCWITLVHYEQRPVKRLSFAKPSVESKDPGVKLLGHIHPPSQPLGTDFDSLPST
jgi:hypothetical protein